MEFIFICVTFIVLSFVLILEFYNLFQFGVELNKLNKEMKSFKIRLEEIGSKTNDIYDKICGGIK
jgi:cell division protein FtsL